MSDDPKAQDTVRVVECPACHGYGYTGHRDIEGVFKNDGPCNACDGYGYTCGDKDGAR